MSITSNELANYEKFSLIVNVVINNNLLEKISINMNGSAKEQGQTMSVTSKYLIDYKDVKYPEFPSFDDYVIYQEEPEIE